MNRQRRWWLWLGGTASALLLFFFAVPMSFQPAGDARIILDHTLRVYIAPPCFEQAEATNYLTETTWDEARESGYRPESDCTADKLKPTELTLWDRIQEMAGLVPPPWS